MTYHKTAKGRKNLSVPMRYLHTKELLKGEILDYGCGRGDDVKFLKKLGYDVIGYDPLTLHDPNEGTYHTLRDMSHKTFQTITCNYVFNVISTRSTIRAILSDMLERLSDNGRLFITVRADKYEIRDTWEPWGKGYFTTNGTYQQFYDEDTVKELCRWMGVEYHIIRKNSSYVLFEIVA